VGVGCAVVSSERERDQREGREGEERAREREIKGERERGIKGERVGVYKAKENIQKRERAIKTKKGKREEEETL
jgi:hypothetical protein